MVEVNEGGIGQATIWVVRRASLNEQAQRLALEVKWGRLLSILNMGGQICIEASSSSSSNHAQWLDPSWKRGGTLGILSMYVISAHRSARWDVAG